MGEAPGRRTPLSRDRVLRAAVGLADRSGLAALTIRALADELGVRPMSLYHHVRNKEEILDGVVDVVFAELDLPALDVAWREAMRRRAHGMRDVLRRHPWAVTALETRTSPGPATLRHHDAVLGCLRAAGFSLALTGHAYAVLDAFLYGFAIQETSLPFDGPDRTQEVAHEFTSQLPMADYPHLAEFAVQHVMQPGYDFGAEFEVGLELVLDGLARLAAAEGVGISPGGGRTSG